MPSCACKKADCPIEIQFDPASHALVFTDKHGQETLMYLDAKTVVELVHGLHDVMRGFMEAPYLETVG